MATGAAEFRQDMPPPGGYKPIHYQRIPARQYFNGWALFGGYIAVTAGAAYLYYLNCKVVHAEEIEMRSASFAIYPMLLAERDREYLKQLRRNRDEETKLMANVEGWKTGTWYGEPIYTTQPKDTLINPRAQEYYIHASFRDFSKRANIGLLS
ncbi:NADH dehydrogenase [ubiquinone] 1 alpha subcomplex subunit 13 [Anoplophora glabripennis]|uniref:NADH dehydrogenase [ubiquinone] 1 alpha subcomplex subunit 13 n=1 Tax=Anoplophora glabripennis TaxID=217634 RepID=UPI000874E03A|nr:NADH dehydrogenase [ubiquinone] 1 alpha subcomplex subunit 13 [Anoplophora glabripennis]